MKNPFVKKGDAKTSDVAGYRLLKATDSNAHRENMRIANLLKSANERHGERVWFRVKLSSKHYSNYMEFGKEFFLEDKEGVIVKEFVSRVKELIKLEK
jgi:hypothetical protein